MLIGLTGGVAAGKSTVARILASLGAAVVDADELAREVVSAPVVRAQIESAFGPGVLAPSGDLDRGALGRIVFGDAAARRRLEGITHPAIVTSARDRIEALRQAGRRVVVYEAALLVESGRDREMDLLVVVVADDEVRLQRLMNRNGLSRAEALQRLQAQLPQQVKRERADYVIDNSGSLEQTRSLTEQLWRCIDEAVRKERE